MRKITHISIHCSASDRPNHDNVETIRKWHVDERGWSDIGYHYIITKNGDIHECRPIEKTPAAVLNHNNEMAAICLTGDKVFSDSQFRGLRSQVQALQFDHSIPNENVKGHNEYSGHETRGCPNFDVKDKLWGTSQKQYE
jgi:N-acetylmuramoyl-L-alanine amidase